jgi:histidine ammonia-lyase
MAPLAARRLAKMVELGGTIAAIELAVAAQALELRGHRPGVGTARAVAAVRRHVPYLTMDDQVPDVHGLAAAVIDGEVARAAFGGGGVDAGSRGNGDDDRP